MLGAAAHIEVEGDWNDDLMVQVKEPTGVADLNDQQARKDEE